MIKIKDFWEGEAQIYDEAIKEELKGKFAPQWKKLILDNSPKADRLKVLDIGTGPGFFPVLLAQEGHDVNELIKDTVKKNCQFWLLFPCQDV